jgi:RNA polymerase sigma-70 factor, ECF subfamily
MLSRRSVAPVTDAAALLPALRRGEPDALGALYDQHAAELLALARRLVRSSADAEDVIHDLFVGLPELLRRYEHRGSLLPWLRAVTIRLAHARRRQQTRRREDNALDALPPSAQMESAGDAALDLERAVRALPDGLRDAFVLKQWEGYSHEEVAELLGITAGASRVRLTRAVQHLRRTLER